MEFDTILSTLRYLFYDAVLFTVQDTDVTLNKICVALVAVVVALVLSKWVRALLRRRFFPRFQLDAGIEFACLRVVHSEFAVA